MTSKRKFSWELEFDSGLIVSQKEWLALPRKDRWDPQLPPEYLGIPKVIRLVPENPDHPLYEIDIPIGATPVCHRLITSNVDGTNKQTQMLRIGYSQNGKRHMICYCTITDNCFEVEE